MGTFRTWLSGFAWGVVLGLIGATATGIILFRPDIYERLTMDKVTAERVQKVLTPASTDDGRVYFRNTTTVPALDQEFKPPRAFSASDDLIIKGRNTTTGPVELNVRIDDAKSQNWMSRFGHVAQLPPGPFEVRIPLDALPTPDKGKLDLNSLTRFIIFTPEGEPAANIDSVGIGARQRSGALADPAGNTASVGQAWLQGAKLPAVQEFTRPLTFDARQELVVTGENTSSKPVSVYLRIDDTASKDWYSRGNATATFPPGPFVLRSPVSAWVTPAKSRLDRTQIKRIVVSLGDGEGPVTFNGVHVESGTPVPADALALRFSPSADISVPGFETVLPNDPRLNRPAGSLVRTPNDPLLSSGLNGLDTITVPWTKSATATVSLWTEDQGEWEYFPHSLNRTITINGQVVLQQSLTPQEWVDQVFLRGVWKEAMIDGDPWTIYAQDRAGLLTATVPVVDGKIVVQVQSDGPPNNGYLAAMVIAPGDSDAAVDAVEAWRRARYLERWPVVDKPVNPALATGVTLRVIPPGAGRSMRPFWDPALPVTTDVRAPRGGIVSVDFLAFANQDDLMPQVQVNAPAGVSPQLRWGKWTYMRRDAGERALSITADVLEGDMSQMRIATGVPRRINVTFTVPDTASAAFPVTLAMDIAGSHVEATVNVDVIPLALPATDRPIGYYVAAPNYETWFPPAPAEVDRQMACDFAALRSFGLTGVSPELIPPFPDTLGRYLTQMKLVQAAGFRAPYFDYTSVKHMMDKVDAATTGRYVAGAQQALAGAGVPNPLWSIADEPMPGTAAELKRVRDALKLSAPDANISGHLNDAKVRDLVPLFDTLLVNNGFGVGAALFGQMRAQNVVPWLYNMPDHRAASGFLQWRVGASGYIQWHARAITADPRDPTDGRETDFAVLPLTPNRCQSVPTVDATLLDMTDGIADLRWLLWLEARAAGDAKAKSLRDALFAAVPADWAAYAKAPPALPALRGRIEDYARSVSGG